MSDEALKKLAKIFSNQNKILLKLAQPAPPKKPSEENPSEGKPFVDEPYTPSPEDIESDTREAERALMGEPQEMGSFEDEEEAPTTNQSYKYPDKDDRNLIMKGYDLMYQAANKNFGRPDPITPDKFEEKLQHYTKQRRDPLFHKTLQQLEGLAQRDPRIWGEIGEHFANSGWGPGRIGQLVEKLKSDK